MAGIVIGKLAFGKDAFAYGLELCLHKARRQAYRVTPRTARGCDVLLVTVFWYRDAYQLEAFLRKAGIRKGGNGPLIIVGGMQATMTPQVFAAMADYVFVGDADDHLSSILDDIEAGRKPEHPHLYHAEQDDVPTPAVCTPSPFAMHKGGKRDVVRIEIARGCKFACPFCALSGLKPYQEVAYEALEPIIRHSRPHPCSIFAPERTGHSEWLKFKALLERTGRRDLAQDARLEHINDVSGNSVTFGLEGISHRLRKTIRKGFSHKAVIDRIGRFVDSRVGICRLAVYFIADLPGETDDDWKELFALFEDIEQCEWSRRLNFVPVLNPFSPKRFTPLADAVIHPFREYRQRWRNVLRRGGSGQWGFRCIETLVWGPWERVADLLIQRGGATAHEVIRRLPRRLLTGKPKVADSERFARDLLTEVARYGLTADVLKIDQKSP